MNAKRLLTRAFACIVPALISLPLAASAAGISGRVTAADGITPLQGIDVQARFQENTWFGATTNSNGEYAFLDLPANTYRIRFEDNRTVSSYLPEWYDDVADYASATPIVLGESDTASGVDASLALGGQLIGTITADNGGAPLSGIQVVAYRYTTTGSGSYWQYVKYGNTQADGTYQIGGLEDGSYRLRFSDPAGNFAPEYHNNKAQFNDADSVVIYSAGSVTSDAALADASRIQGMVTDESGINPLPDVYVYAYRNNGSGGWDYVNQATTAADGSYNLGGLGTGTYRIEFSSASGLFQREYHDDTTDFNSATDISVGAAVTLTGYDASLAAAGRIDGSLTDESSSGVPNIDIVVYRYNEAFFYWEELAYGFTDFDGNYSVGGLPVGTYRVGARDYSGNFEYVYYANATDVDSADDVEVTAGAVTGGINMQLVAKQFGSISGTVSDNLGNPLPGIEVTLFRYNAGGVFWEELQDVTTDGTGQYLFNQVETGTYRLRFVDPSETHAGEYHSDAYIVESAADVVVTTGNETVVNESLIDAASISGTVTDNSATPLSGITVNFYRINNSTAQREYLFSRNTAADGTYSIGGLPDGTFLVEFADYSPAAAYAREYYNGKPTLEAADPVDVQEGQDVTGIDASLELAGRITGTVTADGTGTPLPFISVTLYRRNEVSLAWSYATNVTTDLSGTYTAQGLVPGDYRITFYDFAGNYLGESYNNKATFDLADSLAVSAGAVLSGINASLAVASRIDGTVTEEGTGTPLANVSVFAYRVNPGNNFQYVASAMTNTNGNYSVGGLSAGTYRIEFFEEGGLHLGEVYQNAADLAGGTDIPVAAAATTPGIDAALAAGGRISGVVSSAVNAQPLEGIDVSFYRFDGAGWPYQGYATTDSSGSYASAAMPAGQYRVEFYDTASQHRSEYYDNVTEFGDAASVTVNLLQTTGSINAALSLSGQAGVITGTITDSDTSLPLQGIFAYAYRYDTGLARYEFLAEASSDSAGNYTLENLPPGDYRVRFSDRTNGLYAQQFHPGVATLSAASDVTLGTDDTVSGIDASMRQAQTISGTVRNESDSGIEGVYVFIRRWEAANNDWFFVNATETLADGSYSLNGLAEGIYRIEFAPVGGSIYYGEFYDDVQTIQDAADLVVTEFAGLAGIDAVLSTSPPVTVEPAMTGFRQTGPGAFAADFQGQPGRMYQLERSATMLPGLWEPDGPPFQALSGGNPLTMNSTEPKMFWRVREM
ncbi:MAG: carboxypeptidase regulatory-like domain-containing protein [Akkermansiaceae bacterium]|nr:carboxypeptidase regulatory-like domain-containing protein [Akkermansiaceae bacterium]